MVFAPAVAANAATSVGGWTALDTITAGATNTINAVKGSGATAMRSAVAVAPSAVKVGKHLIKGGGQAALAYAMVELLEEGIDWVLDPANNAVKYKDPDAVVGGGTGKYYWFGTYGAPFASPTADGAGRKTGLESCKRNNFSNCSVVTVGVSETTAEWTLTYNNGSTIKGYVNRYGNPAYDPSNPSSDYKYIPIETVAAKVISNAEAGHAPSQEAVKATALEGFAAGEYDAALDAAAEAAPDTDTPTDPENPPAPDTPLPFDPSSIIAAINALKALLAGILSSITGLSDFFQDTPPDKSQSETDVPVEVPPDVKNASEFDVDYVSFGGQCPTMSPFSIDILGSSSSMTFDMTPLCNLAVTIRPAIIAIAYFIGLGVIASAIRET